MRKLLAHEDEAYEEWGASVALRVEPKRGRGLRLSILPTWGNDSNNIDRLWEAEGVHQLGGNTSAEQGNHLDAEIGYGIFNFASVIGNQPTIHGDIGFKKQLPLSLMGQGIIRLLTILLVISEVKNGIALIDELENGFHHSVLADIWKVISNYAEANNTQIIATTHSRELVSGATQGIPSNLRDKFKYMRIDRNENNFKPKVYDFKTLKVALETDLEIR